jgi:hypothetical protein
LAADAQLGVIVAAGEECQAAKADTGMAGVSLETSMIFALNIVLTVVARALCVPVGMFCLEVFLSPLPRKRAALPYFADGRYIADGRFR